jgi:uncharacterized membrane protein YdjX (TVP38/TMEM64 family)
MSGSVKRTLNWAKFALLVLLLGIAAYTVHATDFLDQLDYASVQQRFDALGPWGPVGFVVLYAALIVATVPGTVVTIAGAAIFPLWATYGLVLAGAMLGASISFGIGRLLGRDAIRGFLEQSESSAVEKLREWTERIEENGLLAVAYLRIAYVPFSLLNYAAPLTGVRFRDYFLGTLLGILPGSFVFVFMGNVLQDAWESGTLEGLWTWKTPVAIGMFLASLLLPVILQRLMGEKTKTEQ